MYLCMCMDECVWRNQQTGIIGAGIAGGCELPDYGVGEPNLGPLGEQQALFPTGPFLQPPHFTLLDLLLRRLSVAELESRIGL